MIRAQPLSWHEIAYTFAFDVVEHEAAYWYALHGYAQTLSANEKRRKEVAGHLGIQLGEIGPIPHIFGTYEASSKVRVFHDVSGESLITYLTPNGVGEKFLSMMFVTSLFSLWESNYRNLIAAKFNIPSKDVCVQLFGDLGVVRNNLLHSRTADNRVKKGSILQDRRLG